MMGLAPINECSFSELLGCVGRHHLAGQRLCIWVCIKQAAIDYLRKGIQFG